MWPAAVAAPDRAARADVAELLRIRSEAERWLADRGVEQWPRGELTSAQIAEEIGRGEWFVARRSGDIAVALRYLDRDVDVWPADQPGDAVYVHGLMVARSVAPPGTGAAALRWAQRRAVADGVAHLRLDCVESNARLRRFYLDQGFVEVGRRDFEGPWFSATLFQKKLPKLEDD